MTASQTPVAESSHAAHASHAAHGEGHIDHAADIGEVYVPAAARAAVARLRATGEAHVWWWTLDTRVDPADFALLDRVEKARARRFHAERDAAAFVRTRAGSRRSIAALLGIEPHQVSIGRRICPGCGDTEHGPPKVVRPPVPLAVSLSRTAGCGVLALQAGDWIGVDVEADRAVEPATLAAVVLTPAERAHLFALPEGAPRTAAFHRAWTRKEAVVKAVGLGLLGMDLNALEVRIDASGPVEVEHRTARDTTHWSVQDLPLPGPWTAALARPRDEGASAGALRLHPPA